MHASVQNLLKSSMGQDDRKELMRIVVKSIGHRASKLDAQNREEHGLELTLLRQAECIYDDIERDIEAWDSGRLGGAFCGLGDLFFDAGRLAKAELMFSLAQAHSLRDNGPDHPITLDAVCALGRIYGRKRRYKESEDLLSDALAGYTKLVGPEHPSTLKVQDSLGAVYRRQDRDKEAEDKFRQALSGYTRVLGPYHRDTLLSIENIVRFYAQRNRIDDARRIYEQHLADCKTAFGTEYATVVDRIHHLITLYRDPNRQTEGEALRTEIDNAVQNVAEDHCITYQTIANVGLLYLVQDKFKEAEDALWEAVLGNEILCSMDDPLTLKHMTNLAVVHVRAGHVARGEFTLRKVLDLQDESGVRDDELRERVLGYLQRIQARHPAVAAEEIPLESQGLRPGYVRSRL
ncbi:uncharacterized protein BJX67DRAFT_343739 [Aspergillus lucknowensis]|uniref:Kinesin light chain n=1 Tax=Aspergillus lucknowensis TaxID=176173 RepID=A0ABR4M3J8_9EURO